MSIRVYPWFLFLCARLPFSEQSLPFLLLKLTRISQQIPHFAGWESLPRQSRIPPFSPAFIGFLRPGAMQYLRLVNPAAKVRGNLANITLPQLIKPVKELPVPSTAPMAWRLAWSRATIHWVRSRMRHSSHLAEARKHCNVRGTTPAARAMGSILFRGKSDTCPPM